MEQGIVSPEEAEEDFKKVLTKYNLVQFVSVTTIKEWIYNYSGDEPFFALNMLCSLLYPDMKDYKTALTEILDSFNVFYNFCPQKELGGKSPLEKGEEQKEKGILPDIRISVSKFPPSDWGKKYSQALKYMQRAEFKKALRKFNEVFAYLLEHKITYPEIYRLYANKGVCHFALGEAATGESMLKISAELNPFYNFAKQQLKKFKKEKLLWAGKAKVAKDITYDIGYLYYQFLKPLKINFAHFPEEPPSVVNIKREK